MDRTVASNWMAHLVNEQYEKCAALMQVWEELVPQLRDRGFTLHIEEVNMTVSLKEIPRGPI